MNIYDIALDFILLDAFEDLEAPPSTIVAVLQNRWITTGMKTSVRHTHQQKHDGAEQIHWDQDCCCL